MTALPSHFALREVPSPTKVTGPCCESCYKKALVNEQRITTVGTISQSTCSRCGAVGKTYVVEGDQVVGRVDSIAAIDHWMPAPK